MAYMNQDLKKKIAAKLKVALKDFPSLKYSLSVQHLSTLVVKIKAGDASFDVDGVGDKQVNHYYIDRNYQGEAAKILNIIKAVTDSENFNDSHVQSDYHSVGFYISLKIGDYNKPFVAV